MGRLEAREGAPIDWDLLLSGSREVHMLGSWTRAQFAPHVGEKFQVLVDGRPALELELIEASPIRLGSKPGIGRADPFSLVFLGPADPTLGQGTHALGHPALGDLFLFLVPILPDDRGARYEAIFA